MKQSSQLVDGILIINIIFIFKYYIHTYVTLPDSGPHRPNSFLFRAGLEPGFPAREAGALTRLQPLASGLHTALTGIHICYTYMKCLIVSWSSATGCYYSSAFLCSCQSKMAAAQSCHGHNCCYGAFY